MTRILHFSSGPSDWQALLAQPEKQWKTGYSARTLAHCWEAADGFPPEVAQALRAIADPLLESLTPILAVPEFKVPLPGGQRPSQNDIFILARSRSGPVSIMVEGKVNESFGPVLDEWRIEASPGKDERLAFLLRTLGLTGAPDGAIRYQLLHRAASAVLEGERYRAVAAVMLVHSFSEYNAGWSDYEAFAGLFDVRASIDLPQLLSDKTSIPLYAVWVRGDSAFLTA